jgi:hypothetical protein
VSSGPPIDEELLLAGAHLKAVSPLSAPNPVIPDSMRE